jgi:hypothetical protein
MVLRMTWRPVLLRVEALSPAISVPAMVASMDWELS